MESLIKMEIFNCTVPVYWSLISPGWLHCAWALAFTCSLLQVIPDTSLELPLRNKGSRKEKWNLFQSWQSLHQPAVPSVTTSYLSLKKHFLKYTKIPRILEAKLTDPIFDKQLISWMHSRIAPLLSARAMLPRAAPRRCSPAPSCAVLAPNSKATRGAADTQQPVS